MAYNVKIQKVDRGRTKSYYVNFPVAIVEGAKIKKGEVWEWLIEDRNTFLFRRKKPIKSMIKNKKKN